MGASDTSASAEGVARAALDRRGRGRENVVQVLVDINRELGYVPERAMWVVARATGYSTAEVYSVASFYSFISTRRRGRHVIRVCRSMSCRMSGSVDILDALEKEMGIAVGETTQDGCACLEETNCIGQCDNAPAMLVDDEPCTGLTPASAAGIVRDRLREWRKEV